MVIVAIPLQLVDRGGGGGDSQFVGGISISKPGSCKLCKISPASTQSNSVF